MQHQIFLWVETIVAVRVLLFVVPVLLYEVQNGTSLGPHQFILSLGLISFCYFLAGGFSLSGYARWRILQYAAAAITIALTAAFYFTKTSSGVDLKILMPAGISVLVIVYMFLTQKSQ